MQLNRVMRYNILLTFFHSDQNISCKLSSIFIMIKRLNGGIPENKGLKSFRHLSCMFIYKQSFKERLLASAVHQFPKCTKAKTHEYTA